jgi:AcrR family transcriptional regulator
MKKSSRRSRSSFSARVPIVEGRSAGRPRDPGVEEGVVAATLKLLAERGYDGMSIEAIAKAAGVGKPTIYRRWKDKADIATNALAQFQMREPRVGTGPTRDRLIAHLRAFRTSLLRPNGMSMLGTILAEEHRTPELLRLFRERIVSTRRRLLRELLEEGLSTGELRADADLDAAINAVVGSFYARYLANQPIPPEWADRIVALVWPALVADAKAVPAGDKRQPPGSVTRGLCE